MDPVACRRGTTALFASGRPDGAPRRPAGHPPVSTSPRHSLNRWIVAGSVFGRDRDSTFADRFDKATIVAKVLVGIFDCELAHRVVECRIGANVASNPRRVARSHMGAHKRPGAELAEFLQSGEVPVFRDRGDFRIAKLAEVIVAANHSARPAKENVACRLHET